MSEDPVLLGARFFYGDVKGNGWFIIATPNKINLIKLGIYVKILWLNGDILLKVEYILRWGLIEEILV